MKVVYRNVSVRRSAMIEVASAKRLAADRCNRLFKCEPTYKARSMSTTEGSEAVEQRSSTSDEAGCESQADRNVQVTAHAGFAELRSRAAKHKEDAKHYQKIRSQAGHDKMAFYWQGNVLAFDCVLAWLDEIEADAKGASTCEATMANP